jgi:tetratricopeptide (TPR) repeat protein
MFAQLCELTPDDPEAWMMRGAIEVELGDAESAARFLKQAVTLDPAYADPHLHLAKLALAANRLDEAKAHATQATICDPSFTEAWVLLGTALGRLGAHADAEQCCRNALALDPGENQSQLNLAHALREQGQFEQAAKHYRLALAQQPQQAEIQIALANTLVQLNQLAEAEACFRRIVQFQPDQVDAWSGLGQVQMAQQRHQDALNSFNKVLEIRPDDGHIHNSLGNAYLALGDYVSAETCYRKALALPNAPVEAYANLGLVLQSKGEPSEAVACYEKALADKPDNAQFHLMMATGLQALGQFEQAIEHCDLALKYGSNSDNALVGKADILQKQGKYQQSHDLLRPLVESGQAKPNAQLVFAEAEGRLDNSDNAIVMLNALLDNEKITPRERQQAHAGLAKLYDKSKLYDQAFVHFRQSNKLKQARFDPLRHENYVSRLITIYSREFFSARPASNNTTDLPVFIVGMPRSGTSLVEQILASHPAVFGAGELEDVQKITRALGQHYKPATYPECVTLASFDILDNYAKEYVRHLRSLNANALRITDKMPHNFLHLGLIQLLFPGARVIHISRDPLDTCLSCYFQEFTSTHSYAYDLEMLGAYYLQYERIMQHWASVLTIPILHAQYESLVENQEAESRRLLEFCSLNWDDQVLRFYETKRNVATPSFDQVRQPMYKKSMQRWKNYEAHLGPLLETLARGRSKF